MGRLASGSDTGKRRVWWAALVALAMVAVSCQSGGGVGTPDTTDRSEQESDALPSPAPEGESQDVQLDQTAKTVVSGAMAVIAAAVSEGAMDGDRAVSLLENAGLISEDENGRTVVVRVEQSIGGCGGSPYCVHVKPVSDEVPVLGIAAWSPLGCVMVASDPDYGVWWGQAPVGMMNPCAGSVAASDYWRQRNVRGVRDGGEGISWQLGLPNGGPAPVAGSAVVGPGDGGCYTDDSDPGGVPRGVNRYAVALLAGTANAGELDEYDHCKYLAAVARSAADGAGRGTE